MAYTLREKDELHLEQAICELAYSVDSGLERIPPDKRPSELVHLIDEADDLFSHYNGMVVREDVGDTQVFNHSEDVHVAIRHFYPDAPDRPVALNALGNDGADRLVPATLLCKDLLLDDVLVGRFLAGITKHSAHWDDQVFYAQILAMSVIGNGQYRENLTFCGTLDHDAGPAFQASINPADLEFVSRVFDVLQDAYGADGRQFVAYEVMRNRWYLSELLGNDVGLPLAFDAYIKQFGSFMGGHLRRFRDLILETAVMLSNG